MTAAALAETARAKVNLALHVVGRRADGYHLLDSVVVFPPLGDRLTVAEADGLSLEVSGPGAAALSDMPADSNLVLRAARGLAAMTGRSVGAEIRLEKHLPVAAGLGGGSADAAAAIRLLARLWDIDLADPRVAALALSLGADVPMCLASTPLRARGIGEAVDPLPAPPALGILLVNPGLPVSTPDVFRRLPRRDGDPIVELPGEAHDDWLPPLAAARNDLQPAAIAIEPMIGLVIDRLEIFSDCRLARMSGSGATCFGLFPDADSADAAADVLMAERPGWWIRAASLA